MIFAVSDFKEVFKVWFLCYVLTLAAGKIANADNYSFFQTFEFYLVKQYL